MIRMALIPSIFRESEYFRTVSDPNVSSSKLSSPQIPVYQCFLWLLLTASPARLSSSFCFVRWAELVYEDIYITVYKSERLDSAMALRNRIPDRIARGTALDNFNEDMHNSKAIFFGNPILQTKLTKDTGQ
jgi:hypothetical protein